MGTRGLKGLDESGVHCVSMHGEGDQLQEDLHGWDERNILGACTLISCCWSESRQTGPGA